MQPTCKNLPEFTRISTRISLGTNVGILLLSVLVGLFTAHSPIATLSLLIGIIFTIIVLYHSIDKTSFQISAVILSSSVSMGFWLDHRITIGIFPVTMPDIIIVFYGLYGIKKFIQSGHIQSGGTIGLLLALWFLYNSSFCVVKGFVDGNSAYAILQELRLVVYAAIAYFATLVVFRTKKHLPVVMLNVIGAGLIVSIWQIAITVSGRGMSSDKIVFMIGNAVGRTLRDVNLPLYFASTALVVLFVLKKHAPFILGKARRWAWALTLLFITAPILSMTRTVWISLGLSLFLITIYYLYITFRSGRLVHLCISIVGLLAVVALAYTTVQVFLPSVREAIKLTLSYTVNSYDDTLLIRLNTPMMLIQNLSANGRLWSGLGFGNMWSGATHPGPYKDVHNVYFSYLVIGGIPGFLIFLSLWVSPIVVYIKLLFRHPDNITKAYTISSIINWTVMSVIIYAMPPHWSEAAWFGMALAITSVLTRKRSYSTNKYRDTYKARKTYPGEVIHPVNV